MVLDTKEYPLVKYDFYDRCHLCSEPTPECMGFVHAGDFVRYLSEEKIRPRMKCGRCVLLLNSAEIIRDLEKVVDNCRNN